MTVSGGGGGGAGQTKVHPADARGSAAELQTAVGRRSRRKDGSVHSNQWKQRRAGLEQTRVDQTRAGRGKLDQGRPDQVSSWLRVLVLPLRFFFSCRHQIKTGLIVSGLSLVFFFFQTM